MQKIKIVQKQSSSRFTNYYLYDLLSGRVKNEVSWRTKISTRQCNILVTGSRAFKRGITYVVNFNKGKLANTWRVNTKSTSSPESLEPCLIPSLNKLVLKAAKKHRSFNGTITITL